MFLGRGAGDAMWDFQTLPWEFTKQEVDEDVANRLQVIPARRLDALVVRYRGISRCPRQRPTLAIRDML